MDERYPPLISLDRDPAGIGTGYAAHPVAGFHRASPSTSLDKSANSCYTWRMGFTYLF